MRGTRIKTLRSLRLLSSLHPPTIQYSLSSKAMACAYMGLLLLLAEVNWSVSSLRAERTLLIESLMLGSIMSVGIKLCVSQTGAYLDMNVRAVSRSIGFLPWRHTRCAHLDMKASAVK